MKRLLIVLACSLFAQAQGGFVATIPDAPILLQVSPSYAWVRGHWIALDKQSELAGPSVSEINCVRHLKVCHEAQGNIVVIGGAIALQADGVDYDIERWNSKEIVASTIGGACKVRNVIKFDLVEKRVYFLQELSEPLDKELSKACSAVHQNLELKDSTLWVKK
jgi:hypothetical protein